MCRHTKAIVARKVKHFLKCFANALCFIVRIIKSEVFAEMTFLRMEHFSIRLDVVTCKLKHNICQTFCPRRFLACRVRLPDSVTVNLYI